MINQRIKHPFHIIIYAFGVLVSVLVIGCAKSALPLGGGEKDETPPGVRTDASTQNSQTNWDGEPIVLEFDEWVNLQNKGLIIVSPPLEYQPEVELRGKRVTFEFNEEEELKENTTYVINFGQSITDYTENNPVEDLVYVMSTGDVIDSLTIQGKVIDAYTGEAVPDVLVQAYDVDRDSTLLEDRPFYATVTKEDGSWKLTNLRSDTFQLYVLDDKNFNYMYDGIEERLGFLDTMIIVKYDTLSTDYYTMKAFSMTTVDVVDVTHRNNQLLKVKLSSTDNGYTINSETNPIKYQTQVKDSLFIWFDTALDSNSVVTFTTLDSLVNDTLSWRRPQEEIDSLVFLTALSTEPSKAYPGDTIQYIFQNPIARIDSSKISLVQIVDKPVEIDSSAIDTLTNDKSKKTEKDTLDLDINVTFSDRSLYLNYKVEPSQQYTLNLYSGAVVDMYNRSHDTITTIFKAKGKENFSKIMLTFAASDSLSTYVMELYDSKENVKRKLNLKAGQELTIEGLEPDQYIAKVIKDNNLNGKWDTGDLITRRQPEEIKSIPIEKLRENWDIELLIDWDNI